MAYELPAFTAAPGTLISVPQLQDPNFVRSVVVMLFHSDDGALGLVINHPIDLECAHVLEQFELEWHGAPGAQLVKSGPVDEQALWIIHRGEAFEDSLEVTPGVFTSRSVDALKALVTRDELPLLMGVGCAGWAPGQLEEEVAAGAWIQGSVSDALLFDWPREEVWARALGELGIDPATLVTGGGMQ